MKLHNLPHDVLLHVLGFCDLKTGISFSMACSTFHALLEKRSFWITCLTKTRLSKPIPCLLHEDLTTHDLASLKRIALQSLRLQRNWDLPKPEIIGSIKTVKLGIRPKFDIVFQVPGTELYVLHARPKGFMTCWDIGLGKAVCPPIHVAKAILDVSPGQDQPGRFSMGLLVNDGDINTPNLSLVIVCLEYSLSTAKVQIVFRHYLSPLFCHWAVFMTKEIVGVLRCDVSRRDPTIDLLALNISSKKMTMVKTDIPYNPSNANEDGHSATSACDGDIFILIEHGSTSVSFCCPKEYFPHDGDNSCPDESFLRCNAAALRILDGSGTRYHAEGALSSDSFYDVPAVSMHSVVSPEGPIIHIRFWTRSAGSPKTLSLLQSANVRGVLHDSPGSAWQLMLIPHSGRHVLLVAKSNEDVVLRLVRYNPQKSAASVHELELPPSIDLSLIYSLGLDDHRGVISLLDRRGNLYAIPYA